MSDITPEIATRLATGWRELLDDDVLSVIVGIEPEALQECLLTNVEVTVPRLFKSRDAEGKEQTVQRMETVGLADLKAKEQQRLEYDYLAMHSRLINQADAKTAIKAIQWRLEKALPKKYGRDGSASGINMTGSPVID